MAHSENKLALSSVSAETPTTPTTVGRCRNELSPATCNRWPDAGVPPFATISNGAFARRIHPNCVVAGRPEHAHHAHDSPISARSHTYSLCRNKCFTYVSYDVVHTNLVCASAAYKRKYSVKLFGAFSVHTRVEVNSLGGALHRIHPAARNGFACMHAYIHLTSSACIPPSYDIMQGKCKSFWAPTINTYNPSK